MLSVTLSIGTVRVKIMNRLKSALWHCGKLVLFSMHVNRNISDVTLASGTLHCDHD